MSISIIIEKIRHAYLMFKYRKTFRAVKRKLKEYEHIESTRLKMGSLQHRVSAHVVNCAIDYGRRRNDFDMITRAKLNHTPLDKAKLLNEMPDVKNRIAALALSNKHLPSNKIDNCR